MIELTACASLPRRMMAILTPVMAIAGCAAGIGDERTASTTSAEDKVEVLPMPVLSCPAGQHPSSANADCSYGGIYASRTTIVNLFPQGDGTCVASGMCEGQIDNAAGTFTDASGFGASPEGYLTKEPCIGDVVASATAHGCPGLGYAPGRATYRCGASEAEIYAALDAACLALAWTQRFDVGQCCVANSAPPKPKPE